MQHARRPAAAPSPSAGKSDTSKRGASLPARPIRRAPRAAGARAHPLACRPSAGKHFRRPAGPGWASRESGPPARPAPGPRGEGRAAWRARRQIRSRRRLASRPSARRPPAVAGPVLRRSAPRAAPSAAIVARVSMRGPRARRPRRSPKRTAARASFPPVRPSWGLPAAFQVLRQRSSSKRLAAAAAWQACGRRDPVSHRLRRRGRNQRRFASATRGRRADARGGPGRRRGAGQRARRARALRTSCSPPRKGFKTN
jgi:hypothetical protein